MTECWTNSQGERPNTVTVYEREPGSVLYARAWDATARNGAGNWRRESLGHRDKRRAIRYAIEQAAKLQNGVAEIARGKATLAHVFAAYQQHRTPKKSATEQQADVRRVEMWSRVLGNIDPHAISLAQWEGFIDARRSGCIDPRGNPVPEKDRKPVRVRPAEADCLWLRWVFNWAAKWRLADGRYLMRENPTRGFETRTEKNPLRPVATQDRYEAVRAVSDEVRMEVPGTAKAKLQRSYLSELFDIANGTGRRISAVCALRYEDLRLERTKTRPDGAIRWPEDTDKEGKEWSAPLLPVVRAAVDRILRERPGIGRVPLFPSPDDPTKPVTRHLADKWLRKAETMAGLETQRGSLWHAYRRKWSNSRKHYPDVDVAAAGGWKSVAALQRSYQQADEATMLEVVLGGRELREAK
jgi:integrase